MAYRAPDDAGENLMDHSYDGIQEYDNPTPSWWHGLFWASIVFAAVYTAFWHFSEFSWSVHDMHRHQEAMHYKKLFGALGDLKPDEATMLKMMSDEKWRMVGSTIFAANCTQCHAGDGGGINGPNLTDDAYLNVRTLEDMYAIVTKGNVPKGMPAWENRLQANERILVAAYAASLRGARAASPRPPEGEVIAPWPAASPIPGG
ncbi:MAG: c-type cytochrome [Phycisphaerales bacterium]|nr:c-type cytochrome [Phycisphaerales bacterium]